MVSLITRVLKCTCAGLLLMLTAIFSALAEDHSAKLSDEAAIEAHGFQWKRLFEAGKIDEMRDLYEPDAWLMTHGAPAAKGVDAILTYLKRTEEAGNKTVFHFTPEDVTVEGNTGYLISKYWMTIITPTNEKFNAMGRSFLVFKKGADGKWRLWRDIDNKAPDVLSRERPS